VAIHHQSITFGASLRSLPVRARHLTGMNTHELGLEPLMGVEELAEYLGVPVQTIYDWRVAGTAPRAFKCGKRLKFAVSDVRTWLETRHEADR
jgi:excisionase family DNA binding protein